MFWFMMLMNLLIPLTMVFVGIYFKKVALPEINPLVDVICLPSVFKSFNGLVLV